MSLGDTALDLYSERPRGDDEVRSFHRHVAFERRLKNIGELARQSPPRLGKKKGVNPNPSIPTIPRPKTAYLTLTLTLT